MRKLLLLFLFMVCLPMMSQEGKTKNSQMEKSSGDEHEWPCNTDWYGYNVIMDDTFMPMMWLHCVEFEIEEDAILLVRNPSGRVTGASTDFVFPDQTNKAGQVLTTDGTNVFWNGFAKTYTGETDSDGKYEINYTSSYALVPNVQVTIVTDNPDDVYTLTSSTTSGFSVLVQRREYHSNSAPTYSEVEDVQVNVLVWP